MGLKRNVSLSTALGYKGRDPYLTFILHRIGGAGIAIFLAMHLGASFLSIVHLGPLEMVGGILNFIYTHPIFQLLMFFCIFFHAINGLRITILDLFPKLIEYYRQIIWGEWVIFLLIYGYAAFIIIKTTF